MIQTPVDWSVPVITHLLLTSFFVILVLLSVSFAFIYSSHKIFRNQASKAVCDYKEKKEREAKEQSDFKSLSKSVPLMSCPRHGNVSFGGPSPHAEMD